MMTVFHIAKRGWDEEFKCNYCKSPLKELKSDHESSFHYKTAKCEKCKKVIHVKAPYSGTGHETITHSKLEKLIKKKTSIS